MGALLGMRGMIVAGMVLVALIAVAVISRNWSCRQQRPPRPPHSWSYKVEAVPNGATILVMTGLRDRKTTRIILADIAAPAADIAAPAADNALAESSRANLERLAGRRIRVETPRGRLFGGEMDEAPGPADVPERGRDDLSGVAWGESGLCLNLGQVMDGWANCLPTAPRAWKEQEAKAKKAKRGLWSKEK